MMGLILKDLLTISRHRIYFIMIIGFALIPDSFLSNFVIIFAAMLPITAIAYDERSKWTELQSMMPYSDKEVIYSKYILGYSIIAAVTVLSYILHLILSLFIVEYKALIDPSIIILILGVALIISAINMPIMFKFGVEKGRFAFIGLMALTTMLGTNISILDVTIFENTHIEFIIIGIAIIINILSIMISSKINLKLGGN